MHGKTEVQIDQTACPRSHSYEVGGLGLGLRFTFSFHALATVLVGEGKRDGDKFLLSLLGPAGAQSPPRERVWRLPTSHSFALLTAPFHLATCGRDVGQRLDTHVAG